MVTANQVLLKESRLSTDEKTKIRERAEGIFREAVRSTKAAMAQVEQGIKQVEQSTQHKKK